MRFGKRTKEASIHPTRFQMTRVIYTQYIHIKSKPKVGKQKRIKMGTTGKKKCLEIYEYLGIKVGNLIGLVKWTLDFNPKMHFQTRHLQACGGKEGRGRRKPFQSGGHFVRVFE